MGRIDIHYSRCVGCKICMNVCSFTHEGAFNPHLARLYIYMDPFSGEAEGEVRDNCDLCGGTPQCVKWCPVGALKYSRK